MAARIRFDRGAWWVVVHHDGRRWKKRVGPDKRMAQDLAKRIQAKLVLGELASGKPKEDDPIPFADFGRRWLRAEVLIPSERGLEGALAQNSVRQREEGLRVYLIPFFGDTDVRKIRVAEARSWNPCSPWRWTTSRPRIPSCCSWPTQAAGSGRASGSGGATSTWPRARRGSSAAWITSDEWAGRRPDGSALSS